MSGADGKDETGGVERLPVESGEKRREKAANSREEDRGGDYLEWCLREYEGTMNKLEEPAPRKSSEEPVVLINGFGGKVTEVEKEEAKKLDNEEPAWLTLHGGHMTIHENQEAMNKLATSSGVATEASKMEEHKKNVDGGTQSTSEGTQFSLGSDTDPRREVGRGGREAERDREGVGEPSQTSEQQQNSPECNKRSETPTEPSHPDQDKESDPSAKRDTKHQEDGHSSLKLSENPQAFIEANRELLVKEGIIPENDEVKLGDKTLLKLDSNEGLTIIHENKHYKITTVEQEKIGDLELRRYKTGQGEEFLHIPRENMIIPPYETPWYALPSTTDIYLSKEYKHELLETAIDKATGKTALRQELEGRGTHIRKGYLWEQLHDRLDGTRVDKLIPILTYLDRNLNEPNSHITAMGHLRAVEGPNLPFKLDNIDGARLDAARFSDGSLSETQDRGPRFEYINNDAEQRTRIVESLTNVFGRPNILIREYDHGRAATVRTSTEVIGYALRRSGAITGEIVTQNPDIPTFILQGSKEMKREWLKQAFGDEGGTSPREELIKLSRAVDATHRLSDEQRKRLDALSEEWKRQPFPDGWIGQNKCSRFRALPKDIQKALESDGPRLLESEARILHDDFSIRTSMSPSAICKREGGYSVL